MSHTFGFYVAYVGMIFSDFASPTRDLLHMSLFLLDVHVQNVVNKTHNFQRPPKTCLQSDVACIHKRYYTQVFSIATIEYNRFVT
jgi:hypothetical protein